MKDEKDGIGVIIMNNNEYHKQGRVLPQPTLAALQFTHADFVLFATSLICFSPTITISTPSSLLLLLSLLVLLLLLLVSIVGGGSVIASSSCVSNSKTTTNAKIGLRLLFTWSKSERKRGEQ